MRDAAPAMRKRCCPIAEAEAERSRFWRIRSAHLREPTFQVVVIGDARDQASAALVELDVEERTTGQHVFLPVRRRQAIIGDQVFAMHDVLGGGARAIRRRHHHDIAQLLVVAARHPLLERGELIARQLTLFASPNERLAPLSAIAHRMSTPARACCVQAHLFDASHPAPERRGGFVKLLTDLA